MKTKQTAVSIIFCLAVFIMLVFCGKPKTAWKGIIEEADGVTVVKNPKEPLYGEDVFSVEEELSIGETEGKDEYMFTKIGGIAVSNDDRIFVLDTKEGRIKVFDQEGNYLNSIGRKGQGPGEMRVPTSMQITPQSEIMVNDSEALQLFFFSLEGEYLRGISSAKMRNFIDPIVDSKGNIVASYSIPGMSMKSELKKFDAELKPISSIHSLVLFELPVMNAFFPQFFWNITNEDNVIWGISTEYELKVLDTEGKLIKKIIKDYDPVRITEEDKQEKLKFLFGDGPVPQGINIEWPAYHWAFMYLSIDEEGRIFLRTFEKTQDRKEYYYDIFDSEGKYIAKIPLKYQPQEWKNDKLYTIEEDEEGYQVVKRYKVTWNY